MDNMQKRQGNGGSSSDQPQKTPIIPDYTVAKGLLAIILGIIALAAAHRVVIAVMFLFAGLMLIYYGMHMLHIRVFTRSIDEIIYRFKEVFKKQ